MPKEYLFSRKRKARPNFSADEKVESSPAMIAAREMLTQKSYKRAQSVAGSDRHYSCRGWARSPTSDRRLITSSSSSNSSNDVKLHSTHGAYRRIFSAALCRRQYATLVGSNSACHYTPD